MQAKEEMSRTLCAFMVVIFFGLASYAQDGAAETNPSTQHSNILFIIIDDLNDWVEGFGGHPETVTPNIAELALRGVRFSNAHAPSTMCNPSRAAVLFGLAPRSTGVLNNSDWPIRDYIGYEAESVFQYFQSNGYYVAGAGKIFDRPGDNRMEVWDEYLTKDGRRGLPDVVPYHGLQSLDTQFDWGPGAGEDYEWGDHSLASYGEDFLGRVHVKPFFLALGFHLPHLPWYVPQNYWDKFPANPSLPPYLANDRDDLPVITQRYETDDHNTIANNGKWQEAVRGYLASINFIDDQVGRLIAALDNSQYAGNTIIVFWGDHGFHLGEKDYWRKGTFWEETTRVPLIFVAPNLALPDSESTKTVSLLDIYPTLVELADIPFKPGLDGESLVNLLSDPANGFKAVKYALTSSSRGDTLRTEEWRYIRYINGEEELYDHTLDPNEHRNLASLPAYATKVANFSRKLDELIAPE